MHFASLAERGIERRRHATSDTPASIGALLSRAARGPTEALGTDAIAFAQAVAAPRNPRLLVVTGEIADAQLDGIDAELLGRLVHRRLQRK
jgi:hypothetical protein